ncbi:MAG: zf-HC2 domain-containing protein [Kiritimatiellae bacterium]|nr:zf-HC2 domain-containing protein [Kiritimatiellia bacterium]
MNCENAKNFVLLEQSGELSGWRRRRLAAHLAHCVDCAAFRRGLAGLTNAVRRVPWAEGYSAPLPARVTDAEPRRARLPAFPWHPALAYGTLSVFLALAFVLVMKPFRKPAEIARVAPDAALAWDANLDDRLATLDAWLEETELDWTDTAATEPEDVNSIAQQLLALEGEQI